MHITPICAAHIQSIFSIFLQWPSEFIIVGTEDYTEVNVTLAPGIDSSDVEGVRFRNDVYTRTLDRYETLQVRQFSGENIIFILLLFTFKLHLYSAHAFPKIHGPYFIS